MSDIDASVLVQGQDEPQDMPEADDVDQDSGEESEDQPIDDTDESEESTEVEESGEETTEEAKPAPKRAKKGFQKRINELTRANKLKEKEVDYWKAEALKNYQQGEQPKSQPQEDKPPSEDDFESYDDYIVARAEYQAEKKFTARQQKRQEEERQASEQRKFAEAQRQFLERGNALSEKIPDFWEQIDNSDIQMTKGMAQLIAESENGPALAYYLATNDDIAGQLASLPEHQAIYRLGQIEAQLKSASKPKPKPKPAPLRQLSGSTPVNTDPAAAKTDDDYYARRLQQMRG